MITSCTVQNGRSDYDYVVTDIDIKPHKTQKPSRKVYIYKEKDENKTWSKTES